MSTPFDEFVRCARPNQRPLRAPYNFVRLNECVLASPLGNEIDIGRPRPEHFSGELTVEWEAETPLLVGGTSNHEPFVLGGSWAIPASSLRGMTRAVMEIASFSRLAFVDDRQFALRDFGHQSWSDRYQNLAAGEPRTGWLECRKIDGCERMVLTEVDAVPLPIDTIATRLGLADEVPRQEPPQSADERHEAAMNAWHEMSASDRHRRLANTFGSGWCPDVPGACDLHWHPDPTLDAEDRGTVVVTGPSVANRDGTYPKEREWIFLEPEGKPKCHVLPKETWRRFKDSQFRQSAGINADQRQIWSFWWERFRNDNTGRARIPVFFVGDANAAKMPRFFMSMTRFLKIPFDFSVGDIARRSHSDFDTLEGDIDFTEGLMGFVPRRPPEEHEQELPRAQALRSRVQFHHGKLQGDRPESRVRTVQGLTEAPRPSFYPFYLTPNDAEHATHPLDYTSTNTRLAGRKRYPARGRTTNFPQGTASQTSELRFLDTSAADPLRFRSRVRFQNISKIELGGLVWALTLGGHGEADPSQRHMLGRAKAFGYGQMRASIVENNIGACYDGSPAPTVEAAMRAFEQWVCDGLGEGGAFTDLPAIADLLAMADPGIGQPLADRNVLSYPGQEDGADSERIVKAYKAIKDAGKKPAAASNDHRDPAYLRLPPYPWSRA